MASLKGILKYLLYIFIAGWMFFLGIIVGRGTSPVTFDTQKFQKRLEKIAKDQGRQEEKKLRNTSRVELDLEALNNPAKVEKKIVPVNEPAKPESGRDTESEYIPDPPKEIPVKKSLKYATMTKKGRNIKKNPPPVRVKSKSKTASRVKKVPKKAEPVKQFKTMPAAKKGMYTVQVAAYSDLSDAISYMVTLDKKGITSYRETTQKGGMTWYRVRTGAFTTYEEAKAYNKKLKKIRINGIVLKKDSHENIKR